MALTLHYHPLASFCHKVLIGLYENGTPFTSEVVDLADETSSAEMLSFWPVGKIPVLRDEVRQQTVPETSIILEYLNHYYPGPVELIPQEPELALQTRRWDRFFDLYVNIPMGKSVTDRIRPAGRTDPQGVEEARETLRRAYTLAERQLAERTWAIGDQFSLADCAAAPALFYADVVAPFSGTHRNLAAYFARLLERASVARVIDEARPYFPMFPYRDQLPAHLQAAE